MDTPNIVFSSSVQVVWEKFANYWEVEPRYVPITKERPYLTPEGMLEAVDEHTIGVVGILGVTYDGRYEPIADLAAALDDLQERTGLDVPLHVDGASGAFIAPFLDPDLLWDFRLPRVHSINTSGHKFGLVYPGLGLGRVGESRVPARGPDLLGELPRREHADARRSTSPVRGRRSCSSTTTSCAWAARGTGACSRRARTSRCTSRREIAAMPAFELLTDGSDMPLVTWTLAEGHTDCGICTTLARSSRHAAGRSPRTRCPTTSRT